MKDYKTNKPNKNKHFKSRDRKPKTKRLLNIHNVMGSRFVFDNIIYPEFLCTLPHFNQIHTA